MAKGSERLDIQKRFHVDMDYFDSPEEVAVATRQAWKNFLRTGDPNTVPGVHIEIKWRNPDNKNPLHANWKSTEDLGQSLLGAWTTLGKGRGALH